MFWSVVNSSTADTDNRLDVLSWLTEYFSLQVGDQLSIAVVHDHESSPLSYEPGGLYFADDIRFFFESKANVSEYYHDRSVQTEDQDWYSRWYANKAAVQSTDVVFFSSNHPLEHSGFLNELYASPTYGDDLENVPALIFPGMALAPPVVEDMTRNSRFEIFFYGPGLTAYNGSFEESAIQDEVLSEIASAIDAPTAPNPYTATIYDATMMVAFAMVKADIDHGEGSGQDIARALTGLSTTGGPLIPLSHSGLSDAILRFEQGTDIDVYGISSHLDFNDAGEMLVHWTTQPLASPAAGWYRAGEATRLKVTCEQDMSCATE
jgi:hypothetical protein